MIRIMKFKHFAILIFLLIVAFTSYSFVAAQAQIQISIDQIINENFPQIEVSISVFDPQGYPIAGLTTGDVSVSEDGQVVKDFEIVPTYDKSLEIVLAIDTSNTMGYGGKPTPIERVAETANSFIDGLAAEDQVAVIAFSDEVSALQDLTTDKGLAKNALGTLTASGNAVLNDALMESVNLLKGHSQPGAIILIADGVDSGGSKFTFDQGMDEALRQGIVVYPIAWSGANESDLQNLADLTKGELYYLSITRPDLTSLQAAFSAIAKSMTDLRRQYALTYTSLLPADGKEHELLVKVDYLGWHAEQTRRYQTMPGEVVITLPNLADGQVVGGPVTFAPQVESPADLAQVDILLDGQALTSLFSAPFEYVWDSTTILTGEHEITILAKDAAGNAGQTSLHLSITPPITINITSPKGGERISNSTLIAAEVNALAQIVKVDFLADGKLIKTLEEPPYQVRWTATGGDEGAHEFTITATDVNGYSAAEQVRVIVASGGGNTMLGIVLAVVLGAALLAIPLGLRSRRRMKARAEARGTSGAGIGSVQGESRGVLLEVEGLNPNQVWPLGTNQETSLGRKRDENDIPLKGQTASRRHAVIRFQEGHYYLFNLKPENPILVNDVPITQQQILQHNDLIQAGESVFRFEEQR